MALLQGGSGFHIFASSVLTGMKVGDIIVSENEVSDVQIKIVSSKVCIHVNLSPHACCSFANCRILVHPITCKCGWIKPSPLVKEKVDIAMSLHHVILRSKAELDHGLYACGVLAAAKQHPDLARTFFTIDGQGYLMTGTLYTVSWPLECTK